MEVFETTYIGQCKFKNRIFRYGTFEGMCNKDGIPGEDYFNLYSELSKNHIGAIITGVTSVSENGKVIHPGQACMFKKDHIEHFQTVTEEVHRNGSKIFLQLGHAGRQTRPEFTKQKVVGVSSKPSKYFKIKPHVLTTYEAENVISQFSKSALFAQKAGFDGIQLHAAHGYLLHQFIHPRINKRKDKFGINAQYGIGTHFLELVIKSVRKKCGDSFLILIKISGGDDKYSKHLESGFVNLVKFLSASDINAVEISYGTMDQALNIIRGDLPVDLVLRYNALYKNKSLWLKRAWRILVLPAIKQKQIKFSLMYNLPYALMAKKYTKLPVITVGGFRTMDDIQDAICNKGVDYVAMCRPFICEPDFITKAIKNPSYASLCKNCNRCTIMCDSNLKTQCYVRLVNRHSKNNQPWN